MPWYKPQTSTLIVQTPLIAFIACCIWVWFAHMVEISFHNIDIPEEIWNKSKITIIIIIMVKDRANMQVHCHTLLHYSFVVWFPPVINKYVVFYILLISNWRTWAISKRCCRYFENLLVLSSKQAIDKMFMKITV